MSSPRKNLRRVLVALGWYDYRVHRGIEKYAQEHEWHLTANYAREKVIPWGWEGNGILAWLVIANKSGRFERDARIPLEDEPIERRDGLAQEHPHA